MTRNIEAATIGHVTIEQRLAHIDEKIDENHREYLRYWARAERSADDLHVFTQQMTLRSNYIAEQQGTMLRQMRIELQAEGEERRAEARAEREALFRILDELKGDDPPAGD